MTAGERTSRRNHIGSSERCVVHRARKVAEELPDVTRLNVSVLKGAAVETRHGSGGRLRDLVIRPGEDGGADVQDLIVRCDRHDVRIDAASLLERRSDGTLVLSVEPVDQPVFERRSGELLVLRDLLDAEVIDRLPPVRLSITHIVAGCLRRAGCRGGGTVHAT